MSLYPKIYSNRQYFCQNTVALPITHTSLPAHPSKVLYLLSTQSMFGHVTCLGQWSMSCNDMRHFWAEETLGTMGRFYRASFHSFILGPGMKPTQRAFTWKGKFCCCSLWRSRIVYNLAKAELIPVLLTKLLIYRRTLQPNGQEVEENNLLPSCAHSTVCNLIL